jgi:N4-gp56 family major capsid protein
MADTMNTVAASAGNNYQLTNHVFDVYSQEILFQAQPNMRFLSICNKQQELGALPGTKIKFLRYASLTGSNALTEGTPIDTDVISSSTLDITVSERGKAVKFSELLLRASPLKILNNAATLLGMHYAKTTDGEIRDVLSAGTNVKYAQASANRAALTSGKTISVADIRDVVEFLATKKAPKFNGDAYIAFVHPHQAKGLRSDSAWLAVSTYAAPEQIFAGEIGRIEDVRFIETTNLQYIPSGTQDIYADGADTGNNTVVATNSATDVYRAVFVGDYSVGFAEALPVEMRDNGVEDFGREHSLGYYAIQGSGLIETDHSCLLETA